MAIRVMVYDDNKIRQEALQMLLDINGDMELVGARENCSNVESDIIELKPDVVLMDIDMPETDGIEGVKRIRKAASNVRIIMQTVFEDAEKILAAIKAGADGYILKKTAPSKLLDAVYDVLNGGAPMTPSVARKVLECFKEKSAANMENDFDLTDRESEILSMLTKGMSYKMIADAANVTFHTVNAHLKNIYEKLHVHSATEAVKKVNDNKFLESRL